MSAGSGDASRAGVPLTNLDQPLFDGARRHQARPGRLPRRRARADHPGAGGPAAVGDPDPPRRGRLHAEERPEVHAVVGAAPCDFWAETSKRNVSYALCNDRRTLLWFANQRAVEYHPTLVLADRPDRMTHLVLDLDPPDADAFAMAVRAAHLVRQALADVGLEGAVKTSGAKGVHVFVPVDDQAPPDDAAAATRAIAARAEALDPAIATTAFIKDDRGGKVFVDSTRVGGATVIAAYSPTGPTGRAGVVPRAMGRSRRHRAGRLHRAHGAATPRRRRSVGGGDAGAAAVERRPDRRGPGHPGRPGAGHARGQAPRSGPSRRGLSGPVARRSQPACTDSSSWASSVAR